MQKKPKILITNDDGITAKGLKSLVEVMKDFGDLLIVAPDSPQSGMGHAITVNDPIRLFESDYFAPLKAYSCSGTPVDCVKIGIYELLKDVPPDLIVSGINHGSNSSSNILYSGTMSAAVEGAMEGIPSIGFSLLDHDMDADFTATKKYVKKIVQQVLEKGMPDDVCLNVNVPKAKVKDIKGIKICRQARAFWDDKFDLRKDPLGKKYYWLTGSFRSHDGGEDSDIWALENNYVSVVPCQYDLTAHHAMGKLNEWDIK